MSKNVKHPVGNETRVENGRLVYIDRHRNVGLENRWMDQMVRDKIRKNMSWAVTKSWTDVGSKVFNFECVKNAHETVLHTVTFDEAREILGWKSLEFEPDERHVVFEPWRWAENIGPDGKPFKDESGSYWHRV